MLRFLSPEWFARFAEELAAVRPDADVPPLALGQVVTGAPDGTVSYSILVSGTKAELVVGSTAPAAVTLVEDWPTAQAIAAGTPVSELLAAGRITLRGDANALLAGQQHLETLGKALGALEDETTI
ncbi:MAG: hypothetical protein ABSA08_06750 [Acidimicrobiales bacterium]